MTAATDPWEAVSAAAGFPVGAPLRASLERLLRLLDDENRRQNLTAIRDRDAAVIDHVADSLALAPVAAAAGRAFAPGRVCVDVGSGGGFPALPLALAFPGSRWVLAESERRKADWLVRATAALGLRGVEVFSGRARDLRRARPALAGTVDLVTARAVADLGVLAREARGLLAPGGLLLCPKGDALGDDERRIGEREARKSRLDPAGEFPMAVPGRRRTCVVYRSSGV